MYIHSNFNHENCWNQFINHKFYFNLTNIQTCNYIVINKSLYYTVVIANKPVAFNESISLFPQHVYTFTMQQYECLFHLASL